MRRRVVFAATGTAAGDMGAIMILMILLPPLICQFADARRWRSIQRTRDEGDMSGVRWAVSIRRGAGPVDERAAWVVGQFRATM